MNAVAPEIDIGSAVRVCLGCDLWTDGVVLQIGAKFLTVKFFYEGSWVTGRKLPGQVIAKENDDGTGC